MAPGPSSISVLELATLLTQAEAARLPTAARGALASHVLEDNLHETIEHELMLLYDEEWARSFQQACPIPGATLDDYRYHVIELTGEQVMLTSLRVECGDPQRPFIEIVASTRSLDADGAMAEAVKAIACAYPTIGARTLRFFAPSERYARTASAGFQSRCDFVYMAATLGALRRIPFPDVDTSVTLEPAADLAWYDEYEAIYRELGRYERLYSPDGVWFESRDSLEACRTAGLLFVVVASGVFVGVAALLPGAERHLRGHYFAELVLHREQQGKQIGPWIQRTLAGWLDASSETMLFGHVMPENRRALGAAARAGRVRHGGYIFLHFDPREPD